MEEITTRAATYDDIDTLLYFEQGVISAERPFDITLKTTDAKYYDLEKMITDPHVELVVAVYKNEIIGSGYARIETSKPYLKHEQHAYLGFMYVKPGFRGKGVIQKIIETLIQWAGSQNITEIRLDVYNENHAAIKAYEKAGFKKHMIEMRTSL